jgi:hypothetical protein
MAGRARSGPIRGTHLSRLWALTVVAIPAGITVLRPISAVDLAYLIRAGEIMLERGTVLRTDVLSAWTLGRPWLNQQWGFELIAALAFRAAGWLGLAALRGLLVVGILLLAFMASRAAGAGRRTAALLTLGSFAVMVPSLNLRSQLAGVACFAAIVWVVEGRRRHPRRLWAAPPIVLAWANLHGSFFLGPLLLALAWLEDLLHPLPNTCRNLLVLAASFAATIVGPLWLDTWRYAAEILGAPQVRNVSSEWQPTSLGDSIGVIFFASLVPMLLLVGRRARREDRVAVFRLLLFALIALSSYRGTLWWALVAPVTAARWLPEIRRNAPDPRNRANAAIVAVMIALSVAPFAVWMPHTERAAPPGLTAFAPQGITRTLQGLLEPGERFFHAQAWGSWFELALPENPTTVDSRFEVIPPQRWREYEAVSHGRADWEEILEDWGVRVMALDREQQEELIPIVLRDPDWRLVYEDEEGLVLVRAQA